MCERIFFRGFKNIVFETITVRYSTKNIQLAAGLEGKRLGKHL